MKRRKPFTLIELLMVISIIMILMGMLLPALRNAKNKAKQIVCLGNLKTLNSACFNYYDVHDTYIPVTYVSGGDSWYEAINTGNDFFGKSWSKVDAYFCPVKSPVSKFPHIGYAKTQFFSRYIIDAKLTGVKSPSQTINLGDVGSDSASLGSIDTPDLSIMAEYNGIIGYRHSLGANLLFFDGHTGWHKMRIPSELFNP